MPRRVCTVSIARQILCPSQYDWQEGLKARKFKSLAHKLPREIIPIGTQSANSQDTLGYLLVTKELNWISRISYYKNNFDCRIWSLRGCVFSMKCRVSRVTYDLYERELRTAIASGTPEDVCRAARGLVGQCFTRRSVREWMIDAVPEWMLSRASSRYRMIESNGALPTGSPTKILTEKVLPK